MNILVTGPFGTLGSRVVARLLTRDHRVTAFDLDTTSNRTKAAALPDTVRTVFGDITRPDDVAAAVRGQDVVIHLAAVIPPVSEERPELAERVNVGGTKNVVDAIAAHAPKATLLFASSVSVHGFSAGRPPPATVDLPFDGRDHYARHKIACEQLLRASGLRTVVFRIGASANPEDLRKGGEGKAALAMAFGVSPDARIEFLHPEDAALAFANACEVEEAVGKVLFLGSGKDSQMSWREFTSTAPRALGLGTLPAEWFGDAPYYTDWMDTAESQRLLAYQQLGFPAYAAALQHNLRWGRWLLFPFRWLVRAWLGRAIRAARVPAS